MSFKANQFRVVFDRDKPDIAVAPGKLDHLGLTRHIHQHIGQMPLFQQSFRHPRLVATAAHLDLRHLPGISTSNALLEEADRRYQAPLDRIPAATGLPYWTRALVAGTPETAVAQVSIATPEFKADDATCRSAISSPRCRSTCCTRTGRRRDGSRPFSTAHGEPACCCGFKTATRMWP
jgi:hypothetical protein